MAAVQPPESFSLGVSLLLEEIEGGIAAMEQPADADAKATEKLLSDLKKPFEERSNPNLVRLPTPARRSGPPPASSVGYCVRDSLPGHDAGTCAKDDSYSFPIPTPDVTDFWQDLDDLMASLERQEQGEQARPRKTEADRIPGGILVHERASAPRSADGLSVEGFNPLRAADPGPKGVELESDRGPTRHRAVTFAETAGLASMKQISIRRPEPHDTFDDVDLLDMFSRM
eukprot:TRINITY_DN11502_c0_g2_i1.p1 TRINITY_DN11502_c0_g2~~TRINITY_DN11502_c0_g2_i1.p1  ORF type:complete len:229 (+),score=50.03 TRINITY_DN11502_c0_g2_i1:37-723(+)